MEQGGDPGGEQSNVQLALDPGCILALFQEIGGEGSGRDHIWARGMDLHIGKVGRSFLYQTHAHLKGEEGTVLLHHKNVEQAAPGGGIGDQSQMAFGKGVAVHDDAAHASGQGVSMVFRGFREECRVKTLQPVFPVFQHQHRLGLSQGIKAAGCEKNLVFWPGDDEKIIVASFKPVFHQSGYQASQGVLTS